MTQIIPDSKPKDKGRLWKLQNVVVKAKVIFISIHSQNKDKGAFATVRFFFSKSGGKLIKKFCNHFFSVILNNDLENKKKQLAYDAWLKKHMPLEVDFAAFAKDQESFRYNPVISILVPVYNTNPAYLRETIESVKQQIYPHWELCLADDHSKKEETKAALREYVGTDPRIKIVFHEINSHISETTNSALAVSTGEYSALLDHDDLLTKDALYQVVKLLNAHPDADFIYSDEDKTDGEGRYMHPHFKPNWCPDNLLSRNYLGHLAVLRSSILKGINGFTKGLEGSQDYDIYLRFIEKGKNVYHIPKILYRWRMHEESVAMNTYSKPYAYIAGQKAIEAALERRNEPGTVTMHEGEMLGFYTIRYKIKEPKKVSIVIPTKDKTSLLKQCIDSIFEKSTYPDFEIIVVDNGSSEEEFFKLMERYKQKYPSTFFCHRHDIPFNFSTLINYGSAQAKGEYLLLLNNDTKVISPDWIEGMVEQAQRRSTGVVGAKLLFPNNTIQHAGIIFDEKGMVKHLFAGDHKDLYNRFCNSINNYPALTGACIMVRKELFETLGKFEEQFAVEYNDIDFCLKVLSAGYFNVYIPHVELYHYESVSRGSSHASGEKFQQHLKERTAFLGKWGNLIKTLPGEQCYQP